MWASVDIGGTNIAVALASDEGRVTAECSIPTRSEEGPGAVLDRIATTLTDLGERPRAIGIGVPGLIDLKHGHTLFLPNMPGNWRGIPVAETLRTRLACPVYLLNDVIDAEVVEEKK